MKSSTDIISESISANITQNRLRVYLIALMVALLLSLAMNVILVINAFYRFPITKFIWTTDAQAVCEAIPLTEPNISQARLKDFAAQAAVSINSYDYANWRTFINSALGQYFTPKGRDRYRAELQKSGVIEQVVNNYQAVTAITYAPPTIVEEGKQNGRYYWIVEVPTKVSYRTNRETLDENRLLTFTIVRVDPSPLNANGIAIDGVLSSQMTYRQMQK